MQTVNEPKRSIAIHILFVLRRFVVIALFESIAAIL
jgi:hypothetical protein